MNPTELNALFHDVANIEGMKKICGQEPGALSEETLERISQVMNVAKETKEPVSFALKDRFGERTFIVLPSDDGRISHFILKPRVRGYIRTRDGKLEIFQPEKPFAEGSLKRVYEGWDLMGHQAIAVTESESAARPVDHDAALEVQASRREAEHLAKIEKHPVTFRVEVVENDTTYQVSMLNRMGTSLSKLIKAGPPTDKAQIEERLLILSSLLSDLTDLHEMGKLHGDIKLDNCIVIGGEAHLIDFGNIHDVNYEDERKLYADVLVTYAYASPELATLIIAKSPFFMEKLRQFSPDRLSFFENAAAYKGPLLTREQDIYAMGLIFLQLLTPIPYTPCVEAVPSHDPFKTLFYISVSQNAEELVDYLVPQTPDGLDLLIKQMLSRDYRNRPTALAAYRTLESILQM